MITIGSVLLLMIIMYIIIHYKNLKKIYIMLFVTTASIQLLIERGYFIQIGGQQLTFPFFCEIVLSIFSLVYICIVFKTSKRLILSLFIALICLLIGWGSLAIFPSSATGGTFAVSWDEILVQHIERQPIRFIPEMSQTIIHVLLFLIISFVSLSILTKTDWLEIIYKFSKIIRIYVLYGIIELFFVYALKSNILYSIINSILGITKSTVTEISARSGGYELLGLTKESSHYSFVLAIMFIILLAFLKLQLSGNNRNIKDINLTKISLICIIILLPFSMSFLTIYYVILLVLLYYLVISENGKNNLNRILMTIVSLFILLAFLSLLAMKLSVSLSLTNFWQRKLLSVIQEWQLILNGTWLAVTSSLEWSTRVRLGSTYETFKLLHFRPIFGLGWGATVAHSSLAMFVVGCGLLGSIGYLNYFTFPREVKIISYNKLLFGTSVVLYLLMNVFNSLSLRPFYELWTILLLFAFEILSGERKK